MSTKTAPINPEMLKWAREQAGFTRHELGERAKLSVSKDSGTIDELIAEWESGEKQPRLNQLEDIAKTMRRPLITFFLTAPPNPDTALVDFRTHISESPVHDSPEFSALKRRLLVLQKQLRHIVHDEERAVPFIGFMEKKPQAQSIVAQIRNILKLSYTEQRKIHDKSELQRCLRSRMEEAGVFVLFEGNLGSYHSNISPSEYRGIAISDTYAPMIVVNSNDTKNARSFTLLHEFSHLLIGESGISGGDFADVQQLNSATEKLCNQVAAEFLIPQNMLKQECAGCTITLETVDALAETFMVSSIVIAIQMHNANLISSNTMRNFNYELEKRWAEQKAKMRQTPVKIPRRITDRNRLGSYTINTVLDAAFSNIITLHKASTLLGISTDRFNKVR